MFIDYDLITVEQLCGETRILLPDAFEYLFDFIDVVGHIFEVLVQVCLLWLLNYFHWFD